MLDNARCTTCGPARVPGVAQSELPPMSGSSALRTDNSLTNVYTLRLIVHACGAMLGMHMPTFIAHCTCLHALGFAQTWCSARLALQSADNCSLLSAHIVQNHQQSKATSLRRCGPRHDQRWSSLHLGCYLLPSACASELSRGGVRSNSKESAVSRGKHNDAGAGRFAPTLALTACRVHCCRFEPPGTISWGGTAQDLDKTEWSAQDSHHADVKMNLISLNK